VYSNDVSTRGPQNILITCQSADIRKCQKTEGRHRKRHTVRRDGYGTGHGYESVYITQHDVCIQPPVTVEMSNKSPILKRYYRDYVPSAAEFGLSGGWSPASTRFGVGQLAAVWGVVNARSCSPSTAKPKGARSEKKMHSEWPTGGHGPDVIVFESLPCSRDLESLKPLMSLLRNAICSLEYKKHIERLTC